MTVSTLSTILNKLQDIKSLSGKHYKEANKLLNSEATTHTIEEIRKFVNKYH